MKIIPLGTHCGLTTVLQRLRLKKATGLFEWLHSNNLDNVTNVIKIINKDINEVKIMPGLKVQDDNIYTYHYGLEEYKDIFHRRAERFLNDIRNSDSEILFIRNVLYKDSVKEYEIQNFRKVIEEINPILRYKILIVSYVDQIDAKNKDFDNVIFREILNSEVPDTQFTNPNANLQPWIDILSEFELSITDNDIVFTDHTV